MNVTQFVMAYGVEQDRLRALLPEGYRSLRPGAARQRRASAGTSRLCGAEHRRGAGRRPGLAEHRPLERRPGLRRRQNRHLHPPAGDRLHRRWHCLPLTAENAAAIPCRQVLGVYSVSFPRQD